MTLQNDGVAVIHSFRAFKHFITQYSRLINECLQSKNKETGFSDSCYLMHFCLQSPAKSVHYFALAISQTGCQIFAHKRKEDVKKPFYGTLNT